LSSYQVTVDALCLHELANRFSALFRETLIELGGASAVRVTFYLHAQPGVGL
jgi:hypothetical protein